jgi:hypothetical protein
MRRYKFGFNPSSMGGDGLTLWPDLEITHSSEPIDLLYANYSARRIDTRPILDSGRMIWNSFTGITLPILMKYRDIMISNPVAAENLDMLKQAVEAGVRVHMMHESGTIDQAIADALAVGCYSVIAGASGDITLIAAAGLRVASYPGLAVVVQPDVAFVQLSGIDTYADATLMVSQLGNTTPIVLGIAVAHQDSASWARAMLVNCNTIMTQSAETDVQAPKLYLGQTMLGVDNLGASIKFKTDIGYVETNTLGSFWRVTNTLAGIIEHGISVTEDVEIFYITSDFPVDFEDKANIPYPYTNDVELKRYVMLFTTGATYGDLLIEVSDDSDHIIYQTTRNMVNPLPEWMDWRINEESLGFGLTNIVGAYISEFENAVAQTRMAMIQRFPVDDVNGFGVVSWVGENYYPPQPLLNDNGYPYVQCSNINELMFSSVPAFYLMDDGHAVFVNTTYGQNLWTPLDEWGLLLDLHRHPEEGLRRFRARLLDVFQHPVGASREGMKYAIIRELSPYGISDDTFQTIE